MTFSLRCTSCLHERLAGSLSYACDRCGSQLDVVYAQPPELAPGATGMWRYAARLPVGDRTCVVSLGEGATPVIELPRVRQLLGVASASVKAEYMNPTGSFKDRIASVALSIAKERGLVGCVGTSSGNGGAAVAAYGARAGQPVYLFALVGTPDLKLLQIAAAGAVLCNVRGLGYDADGTRRTADLLAAWSADHRMFPFLTGGRYSPEAMEGAKTIAFELAETAPATTAVYAPVGGGGLVSSIASGYQQAAGWLVNHTPRVIAVQPAGCPTVRDALGGGAGILTQPTSTSISGLQVAALFDGRVPRALAESSGHLTEVSDEDVWAAQKLLAREEGILVEPAGAAALAGAVADARNGRLRPEDRVVMIATGAGYKDLSALRRLAEGVEVPDVSVDEIPGMLASLQPTGQG